MFRLSNNLMGILNLVTFLLSIPILAGGIWLSHQASSECERWLDMSVTALGVFLMVVSLAGLVGACCGVSWLLWLYLFVMLLLILLLTAFTIFAFVVTSVGAGAVLSNHGYKEYRVGDYSNWLQKRVNDANNWKKIASCLFDSKVCSNFNNKYFNDNVTQFYPGNISTLQSGCCKPSNDCNFTYASPTNWTKTTGGGFSPTNWTTTGGDFSPTNWTTTGGNFSNPDCSAWGNNPAVLCFNCASCKAGLLGNITRDWKKVAILNVTFLVLLIVVYSVGCCAFRNNRKDNWNRQ